MWISVRIVLNDQVEPRCLPKLLLVVVIKRDLLLLSNNIPQQALLILTLKKEEAMLFLDISNDFVQTDLVINGKPVFVIIVIKGR